MLVDAGVIMVENCYRHLSEMQPEERKEKHLEVIITSAKQVGRAIFFSLAIIVLSFVPVFMLEFAGGGARARQGRAGGNLHGPGAGIDVRNHDHPEAERKVAAGDDQSRHRFRTGCEAPANRGQERLDPADHQPDQHAFHRLKVSTGAPEINSEGGLLRSLVYLNVRGRDMGGFVTEAQKVLQKQMKLPAGYYVAWSGQWENQVRAKARLQMLVPAGILIIFILLYFTFHSALEASMVMLSVPFALIGGVYLVKILGYNLSVAVWVGFIARAQNRTSTTPPSRARC